MSEFLEDMGPTFIKLGQFLQHDLILLAKEIAKKLEKLAR